MPRLSYEEIFVTAVFPQIEFVGKSNGPVPVIGNVFTYTSIDDSLRSTRIKVLKIPRKRHAVISKNTPLSIEDEKRKLGATPYEIHIAGDGIDDCRHSQDEPRSL